MDFIKFLNEIVKLYESLKDTPLKYFLPLVLMFCLGYSFVKWIAIPIWKGIRWIIAWRQREKFVVHESLSHMKSSDVYYLIEHFIPTRYSMQDPARNDEPIPEYYGDEVKRKPLLIDHFLKYEFNQKYGDKYYLVLADCGMGKTTFLINLFYLVQKKLKREHPCVFVSLVRSDYLDQIKSTINKEKTILLLDALDENDLANRDFHAFISDLEDEIKDFYRVVITSRTHFFSNSEKEQIFSGQKANSPMEKMVSVRKYYIAPFTDDDLKRYLHQRYRGKKYRQAWHVIEANKNLTVRPLILRFMDDFIQDNVSFTHTFELYEYLFRKWISREVGKDNDRQESLYKECLSIAKAMYYQWMKHGRVGIYPSEIDEDNTIPGLSKIQFKAHAMLNRTSDGMYKFAHLSYWEYLIAILALTDLAFSDILYIRNFEKAESFLKEMRDYGESQIEKQDIFVSATAQLGIANYYLKYWKPEEAEKIIKGVLESQLILTTEERLFAKIHLVRCYRYEMKERSAENILLSLYDEIEGMSFTDGLIPMYTQFGRELSVYSRDRKSIKGEIFLRKIINYCKENKIYKYDLFQCYEELSYCAINYANHDKAVTEMLDLYSEYSSNDHDEYVDYTITVASIWQKGFETAETYYYEIDLLRRYGRFLDSRLLFLVNTFVAIHIMAVYREGNLEEFSDYKKANDIASNYLKDSYDVVCAIYEDADFERLDNPYIARLVYQHAMYYKRIPNFEYEKKLLDCLLDYRTKANLENEMQNRYCMVLDNLMDIHVIPHEERYRYSQMYYSCAKKMKSTYHIIQSFWSMYILLDKIGKKDEGQEKLRNAYDLAFLDSDYKECTSYCILLQVMIDFYEGDIDKDMLYLELQELVPKTYGTDRRSVRIYRCLRNYADDKKDDKALKYSMKVVLLEFEEYELVRSYKIYLKLSNESEFIKDLGKVFEALPIITNDNINSVKSFCKHLKKEPETSNSSKNKNMVSGLEKEIMEMLDHYRKEKAQIQFRLQHIDYIEQEKMASTSRNL